MNNMPALIQIGNKLNELETTSRKSYQFDTDMLSVVKVEITTFNYVVVWEMVGMLFSTTVTF